MSNGRKLQRISIQIKYQSLITVITSGCCSRAGTQTDSLCLTSMINPGVITPIYVSVECVDKGTIVASTRSCME